MIDYKEKIKKLLALSQSPVEAEATAALTKARELIIQRRENPLFQWWDESRKLVVYYL